MKHSENMYLKITGARGVLQQWAEVVEGDVELQVPQSTEAHCDLFSLSPHSLSASAFQNINF